MVVTPQGMPAYALGDLQSPYEYYHRVSKAERETDVRVCLCVCAVCLCVHVHVHVCLRVRACTRVRD